MTQCFFAAKSQLNAGRSRFDLFSPINVQATIICPPVLKPDFVSFSSAYFSPKLTEDELVVGKGLSSPTEQEEYSLFERVNDKVLASDPETSRVVRTSADREWLASHQSILEPVKTSTM